MAEQEKAVCPSENVDEKWTTGEKSLVIGDEPTRSVVERRGKSHEPSLPEEVVHRCGIILITGFTAAVPVLTMNRRIRNRTYGGVRGRRERSRLLLDCIQAAAIQVVFSFSSVLECNSLIFPTPKMIRCISIVELARVWEKIGGMKSTGSVTGDVSRHCYFMYFIEKQSLNALE
ncbi:hypothetical protein [Serratia sp. DD3]|uniref:hypothetical protein n=1 Tax=Serratia sp. DD3 TaxID=1410619 RepID=UPI0005614D09